jgi:dinuclear metal center YbgI/SA1388 family protein
MNMHREDLRAYLDNLLEAARFKDYCPNGLQVEGRAEVHRVVCGVTASQALLDEAVRREADAVLVHHGWFWKGEDGRVTGIRRARLATALAHGLNLFAYHLPLDAHPELGNNAQLARLSGWRVEGRFGEQDIGFHGSPSAHTTAGEVAMSLERLLGRSVLAIGSPDRSVNRIAWCSGGGQGLFEAAIATGADCFVSGEISEQTVHLARESGVAYLAAGHHATERFGPIALGRQLQESLGLDCPFVDIDNPV